MAGLPGPASVNDGARALGTTNIYEDQPLPAGTCAAPTATAVTDGDTAPLLSDPLAPDTGTGVPGSGKEADRLGTRSPRDGRRLCCRDPCWQKRCCCCCCSRRCGCWITVFMTVFLIGGAAAFVLLIVPLLSTVTPAARIQQSPPEQCGTPIVTNVSAATIELEWDAPASPDATILRYELQSRPVDGDWPRTDKQTTTSPSAVVVELLGDSSYCFHARAVSSIGAGDFSNETCGNTTAPREPAPPGLLVPINTSSSDIEVAWGPSERNGARMEAYTVEYLQSERPLFNSQAGAESRNGVAEAWVLGCEQPASIDLVDNLAANYSCFIRGLDEASGYRMRVRGNNSVGSGAWREAPQLFWTNTANAQTPGPAVIDRVLAVGPDFVRLDWTVPDNGGAMVLVTEVQLEEARHRYSTVHRGFQSETTVRGLAGNTTNCFRARATNSVGTGPWSNITAATCFVTTDPREPDPPELNPVPVDTSPVTITVAWSRPNANGAPITQFVVEKDDWWTDQRLTRVYQGDSETVQFEAKTNLMPSATYNFRVRATNAEGPSPWSSTLNFSTNRNGNCGNPADIAAFKATKSTMKGAIQVCLIKCAVSNDQRSCVIDCISDEVGLSDPCSDCWYENGKCILSKCVRQCLLPNSQACEDCAEKECFPATVECSGVPRYFFPP